MKTSSPDETLKIRIVFAHRESTPDVIETVVAWDEHQIDGNESGYLEDRDSMIAEVMGDECMGWVEADVFVPIGLVRDLLTTKVELTATRVEAAN